MSETENLLENRQGGISEKPVIDEAWCARVEELLKKQVKYTRGRYVWTCISGVVRLLFLAAVVALVLICVPLVEELTDQVGEAFTGVEDMMGTLGGAAKSLEALSGGQQGGDDSAPALDIQKFNETINGLAEYLESLPKDIGTDIDLDELKKSLGQ